jgi:hypothetical protein
MLTLGPIETAGIVTMAVSIVLFGTMYHYRREIAEALRNLFGGGPRTPPSHPLPSNDSLILMRRSRRAITWHY